MQAQANKKLRQLKRFKVGIVGANDSEINAFNRILTVTQYRTRCYEPVVLDQNKPQAKNTVDIVIVCARNPHIIQSWESQSKSGTKETRHPVVIFSQPHSALCGKYTISAPLNPSKLIKLLDQFTIKELNFLPEFEIGQESAELQDIAYSGIQMLRAQNLKQFSSKHHTEPHKRRNALVVDDSLAVRRQMQLEFDLLDDDLDLAENAEQALQAIAAKKYDVVFMDVVMPGMDGYTACKRIKKNPLNRNTPVILLTSKSSSFDKIKGTLAGCDAYLVKPINHNEFTLAYQQSVLSNAQGAKHASL